jgi:hypothetical protein
MDRSGTISRVGRSTSLTSVMGNNDRISVLVVSAIFWTSAIVFKLSAIVRFADLFEKQQLHSSWVSPKMGSARFVSTAALLFLSAALCTAKPQGLQTTGKLVCIVGPAATSSAKDDKGVYGLVLQVEGGIYRCREKRQGLLRRRRFRVRDWPLGRPVQVLVDEGHGEVYMQDQGKHRKELVLQCAERLSPESWVRCVKEH